MNTLKFIDNLTDKTLKNVRSSFYEHHIKSGYDDKGRIILYPSVKGANILGDLNNECNGLVLHMEGDDFKLLALPLPYTRNFDQLTDKILIEAYNDKTKIYKCRHGTHINLYYFNDKWVISSLKGIEMNKVSWTDKTYEEMISECLASIKLDWAKFQTLLDVENCYSLGFYHPSVHALRTEKSPSIWLNKVTNLKSLEEVTELKEFPIEAVELETFKNASITDIIALIKEQNTSSIKDFIESAGEIANVGYVFRNTTNSDILIESDLQKVANNLYYDFSYTKEVYKTSYDRHKYVLLRNYLSFDYDLFRAVFPHYIPDLDHYSVCIRDLIEKLRTLYQVQKQKNKTINDPEYNTPTYAIAKEIKSNIDIISHIKVDNKFFDTNIGNLLYMLNNFDPIYRFIYHQD